LAEQKGWKVGKVWLGVERAAVMGVVNITPDSFSDGGLYLDPRRAVEHGLRLVEEGADLLDVGGESTRPGAVYVDEAEELRRVLPVVEGLIAAGVAVPISVDTRKAEVARQTLAAGALVINDVSGLRDDPQMASVIAAAGASAVLMHMRGSSQTMQTDTHYADLFAEVIAHLAQGLGLCKDAGVEVERVALDPGIGFGKDLPQNLSLIAHLDRLHVLGRPILMGVSRKRFIGTLTGRDVDGRGAGTLAAVAACVLRGAAVVRVHDVASALDVVKVCAAIRAV
jgi:dihydropteroate synthase